MDKQTIKVKATDLSPGDALVWELATWHIISVKDGVGKRGMQAACSDGDTARNGLELSGGSAGSAVAFPRGYLEVGIMISWYAISRYGEGHQIDMRMHRMHFDSTFSPQYHIKCV